MGIIKKIIALSLIGGSLTFAILIVGQKSLPPKQNPLTNFQAEDLDGLSVEKAGAYLENSTEKIAQDIARELIARNPNGPVTDGEQKFISALNPEEMVEKIFEDQIGKIDLSEFAPRVEVARLQITAGNQKSLAENYLKNFQAILLHNFSKLDAKFDNPTTSDFFKIASALDKSVNEFYSLLAPEELSNIHREQIRLMLVQKIIYKSLANYENDPLKALIAGQMMPEVNRQLSNLKGEIAAFVVKNRLEI